MLGNNYKKKYDNRLQMTEDIGFKGYVHDETTKIKENFHNPLALVAIILTQTKAPFKATK